VEGSTASSSLSFAGAASDSSNVLGLLQRDSSRYPELYSGMLPHQQLSAGMSICLHGLCQGSQTHLGVGATLQDITQSVSRIVFRDDKML